MLTHRPAIKNLLSALLLSSISFLSSSIAIAQPSEHAHQVEHGQLTAAQKSAQHKAAIDATESFIRVRKEWAQARGASNKAITLEKLITAAESRREIMAELIRTNPAEAIRVAIPEEKQVGLPGDVLANIEQPLQLEGELEVIYVDNFDTPAESRVEHALKTPFGERFTLHFADKNENFQTGQRIALDGLYLDAGEADSDGSVAVGSGDAEILTLGAENGPTYGSDPGVLGNTFGEQRTLVMMVNFQDDSGNKPWTRTDVQNTFNQVNDYYKEVSYGKTWLKTTVAGWYTLPVSGATCNRTEYTNAADLAAANAGISVNDYDRIVYVWPRLSTCGWGGLGTVGGAPSRAWSNGKNVYSTFTHELGHNLGLYHAHDLDCGSATLGSNCSVVEYGDTADMMGAGRGHFNVYEKSRLGWLQPQTITNSGTYKLAPHELDSTQPLALKVLKGYNSTFGANDWYYLEYRQAIGVDIALSYSTAHNLTSGITVHTGNEQAGNTSYLLDMNPSGNFAYAAIDVGQTYSDKNAGISMTTQWADSNGAEVYIDVPGGQQTCTRANPGLSFTPGQSAWVAAGTAITYSVTLQNNDSSGCSNSSFNLSAAQPAGWSAQLDSASLTLAPGQRAATNLTVVSPVTAVDGFYAITTSAASGSYSASGSVTYVVDNPVSNSAPVALDDAAVTDSGSAVTISVLGNDSDPDGDNLTVTSLSGVANGSAKINNNGTVSFTPAATFSGTEVFSYNVSDNQGGSASASVSVTVKTAVTANSAPVANNDSAATDMDTAVLIPVLANDSDPDGDTLTIVSTSGVNGSVTISSGVMTFTPATGFTGVESFSYTVSDGNGHTASATVSVTVNAPANQNSAPVAVDDNATMTSLGAVVIAVLANDSDPEGDALSISTVSKAAKGSVSVNSDGTVTYLPGNRFKNSDSFSYTITDGDKTATATVYVQLQQSGGGSGGKGNGNGKKP
ncbi:Ig-like domain-containing protein [uncultured Amphritea sp.]|uniref:Ig-like domain-containing protein n=1 Tax=uncultured Amphritea sp. TaxID=981605 RepID=UPI0025F31D96|nr:Ig-like domain-containing protein [uncultured Amphritea sp.]